MVTLHYDNFSFEFPEAYNELTGPQLIRVKEVLGNGADVDVQRLQLLMVAINYNEKEFKELSGDLLYRLLYWHEPDTDDISGLPSSTSVDWMYQETGLTEQLLPCLNGLWGPKGEFDNLRLKEFHVAELAFQSFLQDKEDAALNQLIAVLYRPAKEGYDNERDPDGDIRVPFNANELPYYTQQVSQWPEAVKIAVLQFYANCRDYLEELYEEAFSSGGSSDHKAEADGMFGLIRSLAGERWGTFEQVEELLVHTAFKEIEATMAEVERQNEMMQS